MKKHIILILVTILSSFQLDAQSPKGFNYQATSRKAMVVNGENYWLYLMSNNAGTGALQYGFK